MLFIKTDTREMTINNDSGEKYFDAILSMMLEERKLSSGGEDRTVRKNALHRQSHKGKNQRTGTKDFCTFPAADAAEQKHSMRKRE